MALRKYEDISNRRLIQYLYLFRLDAHFDSYDWKDLVEEVELRLSLKEIKEEKVPRLQFHKKPDKMSTAEDIIELLKIPDGEIAEMKISLLRMKKTPLNNLLYYLNEIINPLQEKGNNHAESSSCEKGEERQPSS